MDSTEQQPFEEEPIPAAGPVCAGCERPIFIESGRTPLCAECRQHFIRYPVPKWIKVFGAAILLLMVWGLTRLPANLGTAIHMKRAERAMAAHRFITAQKELELVQKAQPNYQAANLRLLIAAYYNEDYNTSIRISQKLQGQQVDDADLLEQASTVSEHIGQHFPSDSLSAFLSSRPETAGEIPEAAWQEYLKTHPNEDFAAFAQAAAAIGRSDYSAAQQLIRSTMGVDPDFTRTLQLMVTVKRELGEFDSALYYADRLLAANRELPASQGTKARVLLKQKKDRAAFAAVQEGLRVDPKNPYCLATLALVYHFQGDTRGRDALMHQAASDTLLADQFTYVSDVVSGKQSFRN